MGRFLCIYKRLIALGCSLLLIVGYFDKKSVWILLFPIWKWLSCLFHNINKFALEIISKINVILGSFTFLSCYERFSTKFLLSMNWLRGKSIDKFYNNNHTPQTNPGNECNESCLNWRGEKVRFFLKGKTLT